MAERVRVREIDDVLRPGQRREPALDDEAMEDNTGGWPQVLDALKTRAEQPSV